MAHEATVETSDSASSALDAIERGVPDLMLSDIGMPGQDGYELIRRLRSSRSQLAARLPAIALTAYVKSEDRSRAMMAGFDMHIAKPVEQHELIAAVARLSGRGR